MKLFSLLAVLFLVACNASGIEPARTNNPEVNATKLLILEGCNVYRFSDGGRNVYVTICPHTRDTRTSWSWTENQGKTTVTKHAETSTVTRF